MSVLKIYYPEETTTETPVTQTNLPKGNSAVTSFKLFPVAFTTFSGAFRVRASSRPDASTNEEVVAIQTGFFALKSAPSRIASNTPFH